MGSNTQQTQENTTNLQGRLEDFPLADMLQVLQTSGKSGGLFLRRASSAAGIVLLRKGQVVQALTNDSNRTLGDRLVTKGMITPANVNEGLAYRARYPGMRLGDALVELGFTTRKRVESEVMEQMAEAIDQMMEWTDAQFEFRVGLVSLSRGMPEFTVDLILDEGVEARHILLEASILQDKRKRESGRKSKTIKKTEEAETQPLDYARLPQTALGVPEGAKPIQWFDPRIGGANELPESERVTAALTFLTFSEELFAAQDRGDLGLLLLRYASELYSDGGLVIRERGRGTSGFRLLGQFGLGLGLCAGSGPKTLFTENESPLLDMIVLDGRVYAGLVVPTPEGGLMPIAVSCAGSIPVLAAPVTVLDSVTLILVCRTSGAAAIDARALLVLARQVSVTFENMILRDLNKRRARDASEARGC